MQTEKIIYRAVVTGATRGIGYAIAERLLQDGLEVIATGTRKNAILGKPLLKNAIEIFSDTLSIIAAGSITNENIEKVHAELGAKEYHGKRIVGDLIS